MIFRTAKQLMVSGHRMIRTEHGPDAVFTYRSLAGESGQFVKTLNGESGVYHMTDDDEDATDWELAR